MKKKVSLCGMGMVTLFLLASCEIPKIKMHTTINEDGTCMREVSYSYSKQNSSLKSDSVPTFLSIDGYETRADSVKGDTVTKAFWCKFDKVEEMGKNTPLQINDKRLQTKTTLEKHFRWFYTEYTYTETFSNLGDTLLVPLSKYFDQATVDKLMSGKPEEGPSDTKTLQKAEEMQEAAYVWLYDELLNVEIDYIAAHYEAIPKPPVTRERFIELKDSLTTFMMDQLDKKEMSDEKEILREFFHSGAYDMFFNEENPYGKELSEKTAKHMSNLMFNTSYALTMPGTVNDAGNGTLNGEQINYSLSGIQFISKDFAITATSRISNLWAYIVTTLAAVLAIGLIGYMVYRRKNKEKEFEEDDFELEELKNK